MEDKEARAKAREVAVNILDSTTISAADAVSLGAEAILKLMSTQSIKDRKDELKKVLSFEPYNDDGELYDLNWYIKDRLKQLDKQLKGVE